MGSVFPDTFFLGVGVYVCVFVCVNVEKIILGVHGTLIQMIKDEVIILLSCQDPQIKDYCLSCDFFFFLLQPHPMAYRSAQARDQIQARAATYTIHSCSNTES